MRISNSFLVEHAPNCGGLFIYRRNHTWLLRARVFLVDKNVYIFSCVCNHRIHRSNAVVTWMHIFITFLPINNNMLVVFNLGIHGKELNALLHLARQKLGIAASEQWYGCNFEINNSHVSLISFRNLSGFYTKGKLCVEIRANYYSLIYSAN